MGRRVAATAPVAVSLLFHGALAAGLAAVLGFAGNAPRSPDAVVPVSRAPEAAPGPRLLLEEDPGPAVPLDTGDPCYRPYLRGVKERIVARWEAPDAPPGAGGPVVEFVIARDGALAACGLAEGSPAGASGAAALAAVRSAAPFPPLPPGVARRALRVRARFLS